jgi:hypothetical protein
MPQALLDTSSVNGSIYPIFSQPELDAHKALASPIENLFPEILGEIFVACLPAHPGPRMSEAPLLLCRICSGWRKVALSTPLLWSFISVARRKDHPDEEIFKAWLTRSKACPLSIDIRLFGEADFDVMDSLIPYSQRWRHLDLAMMDLDLFLEAQLPPLVSLESLSLGPLGNEDNIIELSPLLESASRLQSIKWYCKSDMRILNLPWAQLTRLHNRGRLCVPEWLRILALCPQLVDVQIGSVIPWFADMSVEAWCGSPVILKQLRSFRVSLACDLGMLFENLIMPVLRDLELHGHDGCRRWLTSALISSLAYAGRTLERLCLDHASFAEADLVEMMSLMPSLYEISLSVYKSPPMITDQTMTALTVRSSGEESYCLLPKLKIIRLHGRLDFTAEAFVTMITSRWSCGSAGAGELASNPSYPAARLMIADVEFNDAIDEKATAVLKECLDGGLDFPHWLDMVEGPSFHIDKLGKFVEL